MKNHLIIIGLLGSLLSCTGQPSSNDANSTSAPKYPYRFHCYTSHIYVDAFLNDSLPLRMVYDCAASFVWLDSTFVDNHYGYESKQTMAFEGMGTDVSLFADVARNLNIENLDITKESRTTQGASGSSTNEVFDAKRLVMPNFTADSVHVWANVDASGHASKAPSKDVIGYFGFGLLQRMGEVVIDFPNQVLYFKPKGAE